MRAEPQEHSHAEDQAAPDPLATLPHARSAAAARITMTAALIRGAGRRVGELPEGMVKGDGGMKTAAAHEAESQALPVWSYICQRAHSRICRGGGEHARPQEEVDPRERGRRIGHAGRVVIAAI